MTANSTVAQEAAAKFLSAYGIGDDYPGGDPLSAFAWEISDSFEIVSGLKEFARLVIEIDRAERER